MIWNLKFAVRLAIATTALFSSTLCAETVRFRLETADLSGNPVDTVQVGDQFRLNTYVQFTGDFVAPEGARFTESSVFAAFMDVTFDTLVTPFPEIFHSDGFQLFNSGDFDTPGLLNNVGAVVNLIDPETMEFIFEPVGDIEQLLYSVDFTASSPGEVSFLGSDPMSGPQHDTLVFGSNFPVPLEEIDFGSAQLSLTSVPEPSGMVLLLLGMVGLLRRRR